MQVCKGEELLLIVLANGAWLIVETILAQMAVRLIIDVLACHVCLAVMLTVRCFMCCRSARISTSCVRSGLRGLVAAQCHAVHRPPTAVLNKSFDLMASRIPHLLYLLMWQLLPEVAAVPMARFYICRFWQLAPSVLTLLCDMCLCC